MPPVNLNFLCRILVVDDDVVSRATLGAILSREGYDVVQAGNCGEAIALFQRRPFDLVITELNLDGKDSFRMIEELCREPGRTRFVGLVREGWMSADFCLRKAEALGAQAVFAKPFPPEQLLPAVRAALA
jgi:CheY-like chemotaxis protein